MQGINFPACFFFHSTASDVWDPLQILTCNITRNNKENVCSMQKLYDLLVTEFVTGYHFSNWLIGELLPTLVIKSVAKLFSTGIVTTCLSQPEIEHPISRMRGIRFNPLHHGGAACRVCSFFTWSIDLNENSTIKKLHIIIYLFFHKGYMYLVYKWYKQYIVLLTDTHLVFDS